MSQKITFNDISLGYEVPSQTKIMTQEMITANAEGSLDFNPIHIDPEYCKRVNLFGKGTTIAHGMMTLAFMGKTITDWAYEAGGTIKHIEAKFVDPVRPGDKITVVAKAIEKHPRKDDKNYVVFEIACTNQEGKPVAVGEASAYLPG